MVDSNPALVMDTSSPTTTREGRAADRRALLGAVVLGGLVLAAWATGLLDAVSWSSFQAHRAALDALVARRPGATLLAYLVVYVFVAGASLPIAAPLTLIGGALFGFWRTLAVVSLGSTAGAVLAFLSARWLLGAAVRRRLGRAVSAADRGLAAEGVGWLLAVRLAPVLPFFAVNLALGVTAVPLRTFAWTSLVGMLPGTAAYVWAGTRLAAVAAPRDVLSPELWLAFLVLSLLPVVARRALGGTAIARSQEDP
jgi:uncharacterized membrane protein YdjX (TVP38/TMEM64 family)